MGVWLLKTFFFKCKMHLSPKCEYATWIQGAQAWMGSFCHLCSTDWPIKFWINYQKLLFLVGQSLMSIDYVIMPTNFIIMSIRISRLLVTLKIFLYTLYCNIQSVITWAKSWPLIPFFKEWQKHCCCPFWKSIKGCCKLRPIY